MDRFRASLSARPRAPQGSLEVYAAQISRLVDEAFPEYGDRAQREEKCSRFLAGLTDYMTGNAAGSTNDVGAVAAVYSVTDNGGLHRAVDRLTEEMRDRRMELRRLGDGNQKLKAR
ncbi:regulator of microtubule dynamics 1 isoform X1, partial [Clarias magur]